MNKVDVIYPKDYTEDDKADYDMLMSMGQNSLGITIDKNQEFLLDLAVKMTIRDKRGETLILTKEEIDRMRIIHTEHLEQGLIHETPSEEWYASALSLKEPYIPEEVQQDIKVVEEELKKDWVKISPLPLTSNIENEIADF
jgi:hypothetical protein